MNRPLSEVIKQSLSDYHLSNIRHEVDRGQSRASKRTRFSMAVAAGALIAGYWITDSLIGAYVLQIGSFTDLVLRHVPAFVLYYRLAVSALITALVVFGFQLSSVKRLDVALKRSSKWFSTTIKSIGAAVIAVDTKGKIIFMNPVAQLLTAWKHEYAVGKPVSEVCRVIDAESGESLTYDERLEQVIEKGNVLTFHRIIKLEAADGSEPYVTCNAAPIYDDANDIIGAVLIFQDITEYLHAKENIHRLATVVDQADDLIVITDTTGRIQYVNPSFERITGYLHKDIEGVNIRNLELRQIEESVQRKIASYLKKGRGWGGRIAFSTKDGHLRQLQSSIFPIINNQGTVINYVAASRDITKEVELQNQLYQAQKMEAIGRLASGVAHDFNNFLSIISSFNELIISEVEEKDAVLDSANEISETVKSATSLARQLLTFSRKEIHKPMIIDLNEKISSKANMLQQLIKKDIRLQVIADPEVGRINIDPGRLNQAIMNLVVNASDAISGEGEIVISTCPVVIRPDSSNPGLTLRPGKYAVVSVQDNGPGMDTEMLGRIFEPFYTSKPEGKGTGLGLSIVYGFIQQIGGEIKVSSAVGEGTTFKLFIPAHEGTMNDGQPSVSGDGEPDR